MLFSEHFKIHRPNNYDWFDTILDADTELFIDPFLLFKESAGFWADSHAGIIKHFERVFSLIAKSSTPESLTYKKAKHLLSFREPKELCLGYTARGTKGAGSGAGNAITIAKAIQDAIARGLINPEHFEELGVLNEGIGPDRISDITATILKPNIIQYTRDVAQEHKLPLESHSLFASGFDDQRASWMTERVSVLTNPITNGPLLLIPRRFLRTLPTLEARDWWSYYENTMRRDDLNYEILGKVDKRFIIETAKQNPTLVREWTLERESVPGDAYDFANDPQGVWRWDESTSEYVRNNPLDLPRAAEHSAFLEVIKRIIHQYKLFIEDQGGWSLLWARSDKDKPEQAAQLLFRGLAQSYCRANNISLDAEVNLGRGPVDFKFSTGYSRRAHLEVKKMHNGKFWNGLEEQLPSYMKSDEVTDGWFLAIRYRDGEQSNKRERELRERVEAVSAKRLVNLRYSVIDARRKISASNL